MPSLFYLPVGNAQTAPPFIPIIIGEGGLDWPAVGAGTTLFLLPIVVFYRAAPQSAITRDYLWGGEAMNRSQLRRFFKRVYWENAATLLITLGIFMLMQPFSLFLFGQSFSVILVGTLGYVVVSHFPQ